MGKNILAVDLNQALRGLGSFIKTAMVKKGHSESVQGILIPGIDLKRLTIELNGFVEFVLTKGVYGLLKKLFLCHAKSIAVRIRGL